MEFQILKQSHLKRNIIIGVLVVAVISAVVLNFTRAKYRVTQSIPLVNGTINYTLADLHIVEMKLDGEDIDELPSGNFQLSNDSYCTVSGERDDSITLSYDMVSQIISITNLKNRGTKCYVYLNTYPIKEIDTVLGIIEVNTYSPNFDNSSCSVGSNINSSGTVINNGNCDEATIGIFEETTNKGTTYYYRGDVDNNYLVFADKYWRIIRINENGSIRVIYSGEKNEVDSAGKETILANGYNDRNTLYTQIGTSAYNSNYNRSEYVGYTYSEGYQRPSDDPSGETDSIIKIYLDNWYNNNLGNNFNYDSKIDGNAGFCNDREMATGYTWSSQPSTNIKYAAMDRFNVIENSKPTFECSNPNDIYTTKIGLITADEIVYAGSSSANFAFYLYSGYDLLTMTPHSYYSYATGAAHLYELGTDNNEYDAVRNGKVDYIKNIRPVINISSTVTITGSGTIQDPYVVN